MATTPKAPATKAGKVSAIKVIARADSFRRAGRVFTGEATVIPLSELSKEQLAQLRDEPKLVCQDVEIDAEETLAEEAK